jgi:hypothetical protein
VKLTNFIVNVINPEIVGGGDDEEEEIPYEITYTIDKTNGSLFRDNDEENASWNHVWKSNEEPQLQFGCGPNNMNWSENNVQLMTGGSSCRYTLTPPAGYVIYEYSFTFANNGHDNAQEIVMDNGDVYTTSTTPKTVSAKKQYLNSLYFDLKGPNSKGVVLSNFVVKVKRDVAKLPIISTEGNEYWYYITSASTQSYCAGKVIYYDSEAQKLRLATRPSAVTTSGVSGNKMVKSRLRTIMENTSELQVAAQAIALHLVLSTNPIISITLMKHTITS